MVGHDDDLINIKEELNKRLKELEAAFLVKAKEQIEIRSSETKKDVATIKELFKTGLDKSAYDHLRQIKEFSKQYAEQHNKLMSAIMDDYAKIISYKEKIFSEMSKIERPLVDIENEIGNNEQLINNLIVKNPKSNEAKAITSNQDFNYLRAVLADISKNIGSHLVAHEQASATSEELFNEDLRLIRMFLSEQNIDNKDSNVSTLPQIVDAIHEEEENIAKLEDRLHKLNQNMMQLESMDILYILSKQEHSPDKDNQAAQILEILGNVNDVKDRISHLKIHHEPVKLHGTKDYLNTELYELDKLYQNEYIKLINAKLTQIKQKAENQFDKANQQFGLKNNDDNTLKSIEETKAKYKDVIFQLKKSKFTHENALKSLVSKMKELEQSLMVKYENSFNKLVAQNEIHVNQLGDYKQYLHRDVAREWEMRGNAKTPSQERETFNQLLTDIEYLTKVDKACGVYMKYMKKKHNRKNKLEANVNVDLTENNITRSHKFAVCRKIETYLNKFKSGEMTSAETKLVISKFANTDNVKKILHQTVSDVRFLSLIIVPVSMMMKKLGFMKSKGMKLASATKEEENPNGKRNHH